MSTVAAPFVPFKGLSAFGDSDLDALFFFGREREREIVVANLMAARLTVLYGPSGVGKSSLLRAGVAHALHGVADARVVVFSSWPENVGAALKHAIAAEFALEDVDAPLADVLATASQAIEGDVYLVLDQFEEYFLYHEGEQDFAAELADVIRRPGLRANVLIGIRDDALAKLDAFKSRIPGLFANSLRLDRLDRTAGEAAIVGPVNAYNGLVPADERVEIEPALVAAVLDEVAAGRVDLARAGRGAVAGRTDARAIEAPYLQLVLERLWNVEAAQGSRRLRLATLAALGGAAQIVEEHLDRAMAALSPPDRDAAAAMYDHLVTPSGAKIAHGVSDLARFAALDESAAAAVLQRLSDQRIVRTGENGGAARYEIFHDVLAAAVLAWRARYDAERVLAAERSEADRRHRRLLALAIGALLALGLVTTLAVYALVERSNARQQAARAEAARVAAVQQQRRLNVARGEAVRQKNRAEGNAAAARRAKHRARVAAATATTQARRAKQATATAVAQQRLAEGARQNADRARQNADRARQNAEASAQRERAAARDAELARNSARESAVRAVKSAAVALRQKRIARARQLLASARALLDEDHEASVRQSLRAIAAFRAAGLKPDRTVEGTLRSGYLGLRVRAVLQGGGPVRIALISHDRSTVLSAGAGGVRTFSLDGRYGMRRFLPTVNAVTAAFSPDSHLVAVVGKNDSAVHVWNVQTGSVVYTLVHPQPVLSVAFSADGRYVATGSTDGFARLWDAAAGLPLAQWEHARGAAGRAVRKVSFSPDSRKLLTVGGDRFARVFNVETHQKVLEINNVALINTDVFSHDGSMIATGGTDSIVRVWNASSGILIASMRSTGPLNDMDFSPDDSLLATAGGADTIARVWSLADKAPTAIFTGHLSGVATVKFSPDGKNVVSTARDGNVYIWAANGGFIQESLLGHTGPVNNASFSRDGLLVATSSDDGTIRIWDTSSTPPAREIATHPGGVNAVAFSPEGSRVLSAGADDVARIVGPRSSLVTVRHGGDVTSASFSSDGSLALTASNDGTARLTRVSNGSTVATFNHGAPISAAAISHNGRFVATAGRDGTARLWNARSGALLHRLVHAGPVNDVRFSRDDRFVVTASDDQTAAIWRVADGERAHALAGHGGPVLAAAFSPNDKVVATASSDDNARIFNASSGVLQHTLEGHSGDVTALAFNPSGTLLATASADDDVRVWNVAHGRQVALLRIHQGFVSDVDFSFDGRWLATAGPSAAGIWETRKSGAWPALPLYLIRGSTRPINDLDFSPRGWRLVMGSRDGGVRMFDCTVCSGINGLGKLARARLHEIARPH